MNAIFDLFCGTGGFSHGFESAAPGKFRTRLGIDLLPDALRTFSANHKEAKVLHGDIRRISCKEVERVTGLRRGDVAVIVGGPPCQGFSSLRPFRGSLSEDPRNSLFEQFASFVNYFRPPVLVMENVVGLATYKEGQTLAKILECFSTIGYDCDWRILNSAHFGVPQKRERLVLIGVAAGLRLEFPEPTHRYNGSTIGHKDRARMLLPEEPSLFNCGPSLEPAVTVMEAIGDLPVIESGETATRYTMNPSHPYQVARRNGCSELALHASTKHTERMLEIIQHAGPNISCIPKHLISSGFSSCYSRLAPDEPSVTITVNFVHPASNRCIHPLRNRALTPREGARLQSFNDDYIFCGNRTQIVKQIGNAVPPLLGATVGKAVCKILSIKEQTESGVWSKEMSRRDSVSSVSAHT